MKVCLLFLLLTVFLGALRLCLHYAALGPNDRPGKGCGLVRDEVLRETHTVSRC